MYPARDTLQHVIETRWKVALQMAGLLVFFFMNEYNIRDKHEASGNQLVLFSLESRVGFVFPRISFILPRVLILIEN